MIKCSQVNGRTLFLNLSKVTQISKPSEGEALALQYIKEDGEAASIRISSFEILQPGSVYS
jgi:hypothetical protein